MYSRMQRKGIRIKKVTSEEIPKLFSADSSPMQAQALIDVDVKLGGLTFPFVFIVMEKLGFDCLLGIDLLNESEALVDVKQSTLHLFGGLTSVPMTTTGRHVVVSTITSVTVPPFSEAIITVLPSRRIFTGNFMIEGNSKSPCAALMVARTLINADKSKIPCRILNPTGKPIKL